MLVPACWIWGQCNGWGNPDKPHVPRLRVFACRLGDLLSNSQLCTGKEENDRGPPPSDGAKRDRNVAALRGGRPGRAGASML